MRAGNSSRARQKLNVDSPNDKGRQGGNREVGQVVELECAGLIGGVGYRQDQSVRAAITGGILSQLIEDAAEQLAEARACIEWYEDQAKKREKRLGTLHSFKPLTKKVPQAATTRLECMDFKRLGGRLLVCDRPLVLLLLESRQYFV